MASRRWGIYPSDRVDYHARRQPGRAQVIRIPDDITVRYDQLRVALGGSHAVVIRWLMDGMAGRIDALLTARSQRVVPPDDVPMDPSGTDDPDVVPDSQDVVGQDRATGLDEDNPVDDGVESDQEAIEVDDELREVPLQEGDDEPHVPLPAEYGLWARSKIMEFCSLFRVRCPRDGCMLYCLPPIVTELLQIWQLKFQCDDGHTTIFITGEMERDRGSPYVTGQLYHAALCAGLSYTSVSSMLAAIRVHVPTEAHWYAFQSGARGRHIGWCAAVLSYWDAQKASLHAAIRESEEPLVVYVDCRWDSSRNGYHGTVPFINAADDRVIEMVTMTRVEAQSSWNIETRAVERGISSLLEKGIAISEIIHDDNRAVDSIIDRYEILNQKDLWHKCKNIIENFKILQDAKVTAADRSIVDARSRVELAVFTNDMLKQYCRSQQLPVSSTKVTLINRIAEHLGLAAEEYHTVERSRGLKYPELAAHDIAYKLKSWIYTCCRRAKTRGDSRPELLVFDIYTAAQHWAGDHSDCRILPGDRPCGRRQFGDGARFPHGGATHLAVQKFLEEHVTATKMTFYTRARENYMSETFHSVINKFATKRIHWERSHEARLACAALDWNENIRREVAAVYPRRVNNSSVRRRPANTRVLVRRTTRWKDDIRRIIFPE
ncbi:hypothetical protein R1sor_008396 [Riccia sorocarpa]|uniref:SAP domain-containing protein n=1 Tax=Riccia sorocarpa TaxID=122646 RepID=A0ABD3HXB8_9MARC